MKTFVVACIAAVGIAIVAAVVLSVVQKPAGEAFVSSTSVRI